MIAHHGGPSAEATYLSLETCKSRGDLPSACAGICRSIFHPLRDSSKVLRLGLSRLRGKAWWKYFVIRQPIVLTVDLGKAMAIESIAYVEFIRWLDCRSYSDWISVSTKRAARNLLITLDLYTLLRHAVNRRMGMFVSASQVRPRNSRTFTVSPPSA
jgi:hypothetical protein